MFVEIFIPSIIYQSYVMDYLILKLVNTLFWGGGGGKEDEGKYDFNASFDLVGIGISVRISRNNLYYAFFT